mgnify:FL=1
MCSAVWKTSISTHVSAITDCAAVSSTPGCSNPTDIEMALGFGLEVVKFFPAGGFCFAFVFYDVDKEYIAYLKQF